MANKDSIGRGALAALFLVTLASGCESFSGRDTGGSPVVRPSNDAVAAASDTDAAAAGDKDAAANEESAGGPSSVAASAASDDGNDASSSRFVAAAFAVEQDAQASPDPSDLSLGFGTFETLVGGIAEAEDIMFSADGRLFVTGSDGIYELRRDSAGKWQATNLHPGEKCLFDGPVEVANTLYVACAGLKNSYLFAGSLAGSPATPTFRNIYTMTGVLIANEIAADPDGRIYVAESLQGKILRLQLSSSDPFSVIAEETWLSTRGIYPNGVKYIDSSIYWTDSFGGTINRALILLDGTPGPISSFADRGQFFDDLYVNSNGTVIVTSFLTGSLRAYGSLPLGGLVAKTPKGILKNPADVLPALGRLGFGDKDLLVTDKGANTVVVFHMTF